MISQELQEMEQKYFSAHQPRPSPESYLPRPLASPAPSLQSYPVREREAMLADINKLLEEVSSKHNDNMKEKTQAKYT